MIRLHDHYIVGGGWICHCQCPHGFWRYINKDGSPAKLFELQKMIDDLNVLVASAERLLHKHAETTVGSDARVYVSPDIDWERLELDCLREGGLRC